MSRQGGTFVDTVTAGNIPADHYPDARGEWQIRTAPETGNRRFVFGCPLRPDSACGVNLKPHTSDAHGVPSWQWDGNTERPTLAPSINCINNPPASYGCGWHGFVQGGAFTP